MKTRILLLILIFPVLLSAQWKTFSFKAGVYTPFDLKTGAVYGIDYGAYLDKNIALLFSGDLYYKSILNDSFLESSDQLGVNIKTGQHLGEWTGWHLPLTGKIRFEFPMENKLFRPYVIAGVGYGFTRISYFALNENGIDGESNSMTFNGMVWQLGAGALYRISTNTDILFEIVHNNAEFRDNIDRFRFTSLNSSGIMFRLGLSFDFRQ
ncbi:MAG: outer membrane beta-barrel protein [Syntrophothermus sp.]